MSDLATWLSAAISDGLFLVLLGAAVVGAGVMSLAGDGWPIATRSLAGKLVAWRAAPPDGVAEVERRIRRYYRSLASTTMVVTGLAVVLAGVALWLLEWGGHLIFPSAAGPVGPAWVVLLAQVVGTGIGYPLSVRLSRRGVQPAPRYADLRRRRLADYRAPRLRWLASIAVAVQAVTAAVIASLSGLWIALVVPALAALAVVVAEVQMWATARAPRMVVAADPTTARRCDDLVRAVVIARLQVLALATVGLTGLFGQSFVIGRSTAGTPQGIWPALMVFFLTGVYCTFCAIGLSGLEERLGGTITGWWGRPMPE
jgi:hypothetical protein